MSKKLKFIDLFAGIGGFHVALKSLGIECVFTSENDLYARKTYAANFKDNPSDGITEFYDQLISLKYILNGFEGEPSFTVIAFPYVFLAIFVHKHLICVSFFHRASL